MTAGCVEDYAHVGLPTDCDAVLLMETDGHPAAVADESERMADIARAARRPGSAGGADEAEGVGAGRRRDGMRSPRWRVAGRPRSWRMSPCRGRRWRRWWRFIARTAREQRLQIGTFGHMGDGNLHPTFLTDERNDDEMQRVHHALDAIVTKTLALGGTITGEHGVGLAKKQWLRQQMGENSFELMKQVKQRHRSGRGC